MPHDRFVQPATTRLWLDDGDWIIVKERLSMGELREAEFLALMLRPDAEGVERWIVNPRRVGVTNIAAHLVDWSLPPTIRFTPLEEVITILERMDPAEFVEIRTAVAAHEEAQAARREAEKKTRAGATPSPPTSASPDAATGATSGSETLTPMSIASSARN